jgi:hypothetical protein
VSEELVLVVDESGYDEKEEDAGADAGDADVKD